jgi:NADP-dependent 3-hydroxy acid dehydrogenase YdfG
MTMGRALAGRVAVVTGASSGIGAAVATELAAAGAAVVIGARRADRLGAVAAAIRAAGGDAHAVPTDVRDPAQAERLVEEAVARHGRIDAAINDAAVGHVRTIAEGRVDEWRAVFETNVLGTLAVCRAALRHMLPRRAGDIVNMTSASAHEAWPYLAPYAASKAAVDTLSRALRAEVAAEGVRVMTVEIHNVATEFGTGFDPAILPDALRRWHELGLVNPAATLLEPADVARAVVFQLSQPERASIHALTIRSRVN